MKVNINSKLEKEWVNKISTFLKTSTIDLTSILFSYDTNKDGKRLSNLGTITMNNLKEGFNKANVGYTNNDFENFLRQFNISETSKVKISDLMNNIRVIAMSI